MDISILEWNINQRGGVAGGNIPPWVLKKVSGYDIIVLTEFCKKCDERERFISGLEKVDYQCFASKNPEGNDILIAVKNNSCVRNLTPVWIACRGKGVTGDSNLIPENLRVDIDFGDITLTVVGIRIKDLSTETSDLGEKNWLKREQFKWVLKQLNDVRNPIIIAGDFNNYRRGTENQFDADKRPQKERWSMVQMDRMLPTGFIRITPDGSSIFKEKKSFEDQFAEDHFITKGIRGFTLFPYDRSFVKHDTTNNYPSGEDFQKIGPGYPDRAILKGIFTLDDPDVPTDS